MTNNEESNLIDLINITEFKRQSAETKKELSYYGQILDILNNLN